MGDAHDTVVHTLLGPAQKIVCHGISFFYFNSLLCGVCHCLIVFLQVAYVGKGEESGGVVRFLFCHAFQQFMCFAEGIGLNVNLAQIAHGFKVLLKGKGFREAFDCIIGTPHALCTHAVILEYLEVLLIVFLFLSFRFLLFAGEERFKESHNLYFLGVLFLFFLQTYIKILFPYQELRLKRKNIRVIIDGII